MNTCETAGMQSLLQNAGYTVVSQPEQADIFLFNSCTVTAVSDKKTRNAIRRAQKLNPDAAVGVCGCYAQANPDEIRKLDVDVLVGTADRRAFISHLEPAAEHKQKWEKIEDNRLGQDFEILPAGGLTARTRALLKVEDGCNNFCSYCIVPYVRGRERSRKPEEIIEEVKGLVAAGYKDITVLGQNVNSYGKDLDCGVDFADLLASLAELPGDFWLRFMTSHPKDASKKLFDTIASHDKICNQFHLPFQSGNDRVLKTMNRHYNRAQYLELVDYGRSVMPDLVLTSDVIVGFPGETEEEFEDTISLIEKVRYDALFTFIFSPRGGTPAAKMEDPTPKEEKSRRFDRLCTVQNRISQEIHQGYVGKTMKVLVDGREGDNLTARTEGGRLVRLPGPDSLIGQFINARITGCTTWSLVGEVSD